jgi:hypothetical protein
MRFDIGSDDIEDDDGFAADDSFGADGAGEGISLG